MLWVHVTAFYGRVQMCELPGRLAYVPAHHEALGRPAGRQGRTG